MQRLRELAYLLYMVPGRPALVAVATIGIILTIGLLAAQPVADILKVALSLLVLAYASYRDIKQRTVPNKIWLLMLPVGFPFVLYDILSNGATDILRVLLSLGITSALCYLFFRLHLFGGADAKCLICIALIFPVHPQFVVFTQRFPVYGNVPEAFPLAMLTIIYGALLAFLVPVFLFLRNLQKLAGSAVLSIVDTVSRRSGLLAFLSLINRSLHNLGKLSIKAVLADLGKSFLGYRVSIDQIAKRNNVKLMHIYEENNGKVSRRFSFGGIRVDDSTLETLRRYHKQGQIPDELWVTPDLPFVLFITCGFVIAAFLGL